MDLSEELKQKIRDIPDKPGCYLMRDRRGGIIYVGKAVSLRKRVQSYFRESTRRRSPPKLRSMVNSVADLEYIVTRSEAEALLLEGKLIKEYRPRFNVTLRDDKRYIMIRIYPQHDWPRFELCRIRRDDGGWYAGPFTSSAAARTACDFVERRYGLRKCTPRVPDAETYRHCLDDIIRQCSAPCIGRISREEYHKRVEEACAFLRGERPAVLREVHDAMTAAAEQKEYETAANLRDIYFMLRQVVTRRINVSANRQSRNEDAQAALDELCELLQLSTRPDWIEGYDISNISGTFAVGSMVCLIAGRPQRNRYRRFRVRTVDGSDDFRMMAEVIDRRFRDLMEKNEGLPDLVVLDGGLGQLHAAQNALMKLDLADVVCISLAKKFEEIYVTGSSRPLVLSRSSPALRLLQRLRDEAHRFALTYHRALRQQKIRESVLDDVPGVGAKRKGLLLKHFGSPRALLKADEGELAQVPGIGKEMARLIYAGLRSA